jgi:hypothetical protein
VDTRLEDWFKDDLLIAAAFSDGENTARATAALVAGSETSAFVCPAHSTALAVIDCIGRGTTTFFGRATAVQAAADVVRVRSIVENIRASAIHTRDLVKVLESFDMPDLVMLRHNDTRWTGYYLMLMRFCDNYPAVRKLFASDASIANVTTPPGDAGLQLQFWGGVFTVHDLDQLHLRVSDYLPSFVPVYDPGAPNAHRGVATRRSGRRKCWVAH